MSESSVLVIGIGNEFRSDDAAGLEAFRLLNQVEDFGGTVMKHPGEGVTLMEAWKGYEKVFLVDAVSSASPPGSIHRMNAQADPIPSKFFSCSTHNFGVAEAVELARSLDQLPNHLQVYGIEGKTFDPGEGLSPEVAEAVEKVVKEIQNQVSSF